MDRSKEIIKFLYEKTSKVTKKEMIEDLVYDFLGESLGCNFKLNEDVLDEFGCYGITTEEAWYQDELYSGISGLILLFNKVFQVDIELIKVSSSNDAVKTTIGYAWAGVIDGELLFDSMQFDFE